MANYPKVKIKPSFRSSFGSSVADIDVEEPKIKLPELTPALSAIDCTVTSIIGK